MQLPEDDIVLFVERMRKSIQDETFVKATLSKSVGSDRRLKNVYLRLIELKETPHLSFTFRYLTKDEVKNHAIEAGLAIIQLWLGNDFLQADLFTIEADVSLLFNKKRKARLFVKKPSQQQRPNLKHDHAKTRLISAKDNLYLQALGISNAKGDILKSGQKKFRQINKYIEIIDSVLKKHPLAEAANIVDMGSGKGYLTFALYDFLRQNSAKISITGIELRQHLVDTCNDLARDCHFEKLHFLAKDIADFPSHKIDMLIALHACDIATDIAIAKGIRADAAIIIVAPCCHKQVRQSMYCTTEMQAILQHGILAERQAELLTDGIRALLLEANGYQTKVFEFISTEHTPKNVIIVATKGKANTDAYAKVEAIKAQFGIKAHYLETLLLR